MSEKPILFSATMVQAILNTKPGVWPAEPIDPSKPHKWQTRRIMRPQPVYIPIEQMDKITRLCHWTYKSTCWHPDEEMTHLALEAYAPYKTGDLLWVRETCCSPNNGEYYYYNSDYSDGAKSYWYDPAHWCDYPKWKPSIFMPREAARILLEVKTVRAERLKNISDKDLEAEGIKIECGPLTSCPECNRDSYMKLWNGLNAKRGYEWDVNPWVWGYEFMVKEIKADS